MADSFVQIVASGSTDTFNIPFGYLDPAHLTAKVDGVETAFTLPSTSQFQLAGGNPTAGKIVEIRRQTPRDVRQVVWTNASNLTASDLNTSDLQLLYIVQEAFDASDQAISLDSDGTFDAENKRIKNVGPPVSPNDAVSKAYVDAVTVDIVDDAQAAADAANATLGLTEDIKDDVLVLKGDVQVIKTDTQAVLAEAVSARDAAISAASGMKWRPSVRLASTTGTSVTSATGSYDGVTANIGDRILLKNQTGAAQNGVYIFNGVGVAMTRALDADTWAELVSQVVVIEEGNTNADQIFICTVNNGGTLNTTAVTWTPLQISLPDGSVTTAKVVDGAITFTKFASAALGTSADIASGSTTKIPTAAAVKDYVKSPAMLGAPVTVSGTQVDLTGIPAGTKRFTLNFDNIVLSASVNTQILLGTSAGVETSGYSSYAAVIGVGGSASTTGILFAGPASGVTCSLDFSLADETNNVWIVDWCFIAPNGQGPLGYGRKALAGQIDRVRLAISGGTFTSGKASILLN